MKMQFDERDIYDIRIDQASLEESKELRDLEPYDIDIDSVEYYNDSVIINISGTCVYHDRDGHWGETYKLEGALEMKESRFNGEYTSAAEDGCKYINFNGKIDMSINTDIDIDIKEDIISDDLKDTIYEIAREFNDTINEDNVWYGIFEYIIPYLTNTDKIISEIKNIEQKDITIDELSEYFSDHCDFDEAQYSKLSDLLFTELKKIIKNGKINEIMKNIIDDVDDRFLPETYDIKARVYFSDLDP